MTKEQVKSTFIKNKQNIIEAITDEIDNNTIHIKKVGQVLIDYGVNDIQNMLTIQKYLLQNNIEIKRG